MGNQLRSIAVLYELLGVVLVAVAIVRLTARTRIPYPVFLVLEGIVWGLLRRGLSLPLIPIPPDVIFVALIPPLLVSAAFDVPARQLKVNAAPIGSLAIALVVATTLAVGALVHALLPALSFAAACVIGAIVAPPDPVTASSVVRELGVPNRLALILKGEGLINDATAITLFRIALLAALGSITFGAGVWVLTRAIVFGIAAGVLVAWLATLALRQIDEPVIEVVVSWCAAYASYASAEAISGSGILACLATGLLMRERLHEVSGPRARLSRRAAWNALVFVIEVVVFTLIGREFADLIEGQIPTAVWTAALWVCAAVIALRMAWMFTVPYAMRVMLPERIRGVPLSARERLLLGWAGMRGVISLAMVLSLPGGRHGLPERTAMTAITLLVIFLTLLVQGVSLPWVIGWLGLSHAGELDTELDQTRDRAAQAALERLRSLATEEPVPADLVAFVRETYERSLGEKDEERSAAFRRLREATLQAEREVVRERWDEGELSSDAAEQLEHEIDVQEITLGGVSPPSK